MNTLAINQLSTFRWEFEEDAQAYASHGFDGIGLFRPKVDDFGIDRCSDLLRELDLSVTSLSWAGGFTGSDGRGFDDAVRDAMDAVIDAANLRAGSLVVLAGGRNNHIRKHARRTLCQALKQVSAVAEEFGVLLSLEPFHPGCGQEWSFINDLESTLHILESVGSPNLGLVLDTYHVGMDEEVLSWLPHVSEHLHLLQLGDGRHSPLGEMNRCLLGDGCVPIGEIVHTLLDLGYDGPIEAEVIGEDVESLDYEMVLGHTRSYLDMLTGSKVH
ncbi:Sugar phosphate isomerase/epimerase [Neorhodopirellula lusitana]|uniref:Sugar phosphate isomerase/epimerase n=1 Tax=Neorhodopirellula lusitana TaxID=445327 RepID=A0ABY1PV43_9BACT|nr:sugar phosphate isomerase/epimerase family protein [Neorhodopirellula lusitana]SMP49923.1 Sugar phosphate isomerase/epimerase [Neorhodopirellula lusitana]